MAFQFKLIISPRFSSTAKILLQPEVNSREAHQGNDRRSVNMKLQAVPAKL